MLSQEPLWRAAGVAAGALERTPADRLALDDAAGKAEVLMRLICTYSIYHIVKVTWAAVLPPDSRRDAPSTITTAVALQEHAHVAIKRIATSRDVPEVGHASARARSRAPDEWT